MTLTPIDDTYEVTLTESRNVVRAQMLSRRANDLSSTLIENESPVDASTALMFDRRNHGSQTRKEPKGGTGVAGLRSQDG